MIIKNVNITVQGEESILSQKIVLFKNDDGIKINFKIHQTQYKFDKNPDDLVNVFNAQSSSILILKPNKQSFTTSKTNITDNTVSFTITKDMIDELEELGEYGLQIHLFDGYNNRLTIPPVKFLVKDTI